MNLSKAPSNMIKMPFAYAGVHSHPCDNYFCCSQKYQPEPNNHTNLLTYSWTRGWIKNGSKSILFTLKLRWVWDSPGKYETAHELLYLWDFLRSSGFYPRSGFWYKKSQNEGLFRSFVLFQPLEISCDKWITSDKYRK